METKDWGTEAGSRTERHLIFRNYNYKSGEKKDTFVQDPNEAREELGLEPTNQSPFGSSTIDDDLGFASRHPGTFTCDHLLSFFRII